MNALLFVALLAVADIPDEHKLEIEGCMATTDGVMCVVSAKALKEYITRRVEIAKDLAALKAAQPKCADVEITEPSKKYPMTPEPKPAVPFKLERNS